MYKPTNKEILIEGISNQKPVTADITFLQNQQMKPLIIFAHGFKGFKDWGPWPLLAKKVAVEGFCFCKLNFSFNGTSPEKLHDITDLDAFGHNNFSRELEDLDRLMDYLNQPEQLEQFEIDPEKIFIIGHSRGGGISIIKGAEEDRIKKVATWASVHDFASRFSEAELTYWKTHGVVYAKNSRTGENYPMYYQFVEDFLKNGDRFIIEKTIEKLNKPLLVVHGTNDETVNINAAFQLHEWKPDSELIVIEQANHTFGAKHPHDAKELPNDLQTVLKKTLEFFNS